MAKQLISTGQAKGAADLALAILRIAAGGVLLWGALTKLLDDARLAELASAWHSSGVWQAELLVNLAVGLQLVLAALLLLGLFARTAGIVVAILFTSAAAVSGIFATGNWWAFALLILLLLYFGAAGGGRLSIDGLRRRRLAAAMASDSRSLDELMASMGIRSQKDGNYAG